MKKYILFFLSLIVSFSITTLAGNLRSLEGKTVIIPKLPVNEGFLHYNKPIPCVYSESAINKGKFKDEYIYRGNIFGDTIKIESINEYNIGKKDEYAVIICWHKGNKVGIYIPTRFDSENPPFSALWFSNIHRNSGWAKIYGNGRLRDLEIPFIDVSQCDSIASLYKGTIISPINSNCTKIFDEERDYSINGGNMGVLLGRLYSFEDLEIVYPTTSNDEFYYWINRKYECYPYLSIKLKDVKGKIIHFPVRTHSLEFESVSSCANLQKYPSLNSFSNFFISEDSLISISKSRFDIENVDSIRNNFIGKEIYFESHGNPEEPTLRLSDTYDVLSTVESPNGYSTLERIVLMPSSKHKPYMWYYAICKSAGNTIAIPIDSTFSAGIILAETHRLRLEQEEREANELARIRQEQEEQEERDYLNGLIRKYGKANALLIIDGSVKLGFTKSMCEEAWGTPYDKTRVTTQYGTAEAWWYGNGNILYFRGNKLVIIQD